MIPGNADPRRPDKIQRFKPPTTGSAAAPGEDLTPDYMNILGPDSTSGNADNDSKSGTVEPININGPTQQARQQQQQQQPQQNLPQSQQKEDVPKTESSSITTNNTINVIPTSPQYGVAIIPTTVTAATLSNDSGTANFSINNGNNLSAVVEGDIKDMNTTPNKNDRFKVVKIASAEPFRRGRWKCMDYVDQVPPSSSQSKTAQSQVTAALPMTGNIYMQSQSLPPHQIQQLLLQSGYNATPQYFQGAQVLPPQTQYFYQTNVHPQNIPMMIPQSALQSQFVTGNNQQQQHPQFFQPAVITTGSVPASFPGVQFLQQGNSAFVPTSQGVQIPHSFGSAQTGSNNNTPGQTYAENSNQPLVNGYAYSTQPNEQQQQQQPLQQQIVAQHNQVAKNVLLNQGTNVDVHLNHTQAEIMQSMPTNVFAAVLPPNQGMVVQTTSMSYDPNTPTSMYTNPQFVASVNSLPDRMSSNDQKDHSLVAVVGTESSDSNALISNLDDPAKTNPVVNAIDNKIEQAMDLVKSHLMYTVREEVEVLKEKIAELMERIQQLETENNFLKSQIPKPPQQAAIQNGGDEPPPSGAAPPTVPSSNQ